MSKITVNEPLLNAKLSELESARDWSQGVIGSLHSRILESDDYTLFRINPLTYAAENGISEHEAIDLFLNCTKCGLFELEWNLLCSFCAHIVKNFQELARLHPDFICDFCGAENHAALDDYIHISFTISHSVRGISFHDPESLPIEDYYLKYQFARGGIYKGDHSLEEVVGLITRLMSYIEPNNTTRFVETLPQGTLQIRDLSMSAALTLPLGEPEQSLEKAAAIRLEDGQFILNDKSTETQIVEMPVAPFHLRLTDEMPAGKVSIDFTNLTTSKSALWVMYFPPEFQSDYVKFNSAFSGKRLLTTQTFRDLFRFETGPTSESIDVKDITFLFTDLKDSTALYDRIGDMNAYYLVRQHFEKLTQVVDECNGAIVKTIGDAIMATFVNPVDAVRAAKGLLHEVNALNKTIADDISLKVGIHRGPSIVVTLNDRIDYFGQTVNIAARIQGLAGAGEICISEDISRYPGVHDELQNFKVSLERAQVKSVREILDVHRIFNSA